MSAARKVLFVDASAGAAGDMILGALVDLGVPLARIRRAVRTLPISGWTLGSRRVVRCGLAARKVRVGVTATQPHRGWRELQRILRAGELSPTTLRRALRIFRRLIEAEARVHGVTPERVHLHEAGAVDAIVDVVGACVGIEHLAPAAIVVSPMTTGFGSVTCQHGEYPVPGPATLELVRGMPIESGPLPVERLTPTGAAILTTLADAWSPLPPMRPLAVGYGAGDRDLGNVPNLLRMVLGESTVPPAEIGGEAAQVLVLECTVDDATPQALAFACERLLEAGALDAFTTPVVMKKGRSGHRLTVLGRAERLRSLADVVFGETSTLGVRFRLEDRIELEREEVVVRTALGRVRVKLGLAGGRVVRVWPEYEDCAALARRHGRPLAEVQQAALDAARAHPRLSRRPRG